MNPVTQVARGERSSSHAGRSATRPNDRFVAQMEAAYVQNT